MAGKFLWNFPPNRSVERTFLELHSTSININRENIHLVVDATRKARRPNKNKKEKNNSSSPIFTKRMARRQGVSDPLLSSDYYASLFFNIYEIFLFNGVYVDRTNPRGMRFEASKWFIIYFVHNRETLRWTELAPLQNSRLQCTASLVDVRFGNLYFTCKGGKITITSSTRLFFMYTCRNETTNIYVRT